MNDYNLYPNGSEWRKWDLHIHTPASFFWQGGKSLKDMNNDEKEQGLKDFIKAVNESDVEVFCVMDYWTFDWYLELQEYIKDNPGLLKKLVLPGMELRIECPVDYRLNIHCILSNTLSRQELLDFKSELYIRAIDKKLSDDGLITFAESLDNSKADKFGFKSPETLSRNELLMLGSKTAEITKGSLLKAFDQIPYGTGYIILPYDTSDGLLKLNWEEHPHDDNYFMQSAHIFESRDNRNIDLFNGKKTAENEEFFENFFKTIGSKPKPCIAGSDAHKYSDYGVYPSNKTTWIKADPTFEGLKQIIYEPELRVKIQPHQPEEKYNYLTIESVRYIDDDSRKVLPQESLKLSTYLNSIIGGKSSGKSLLLFNIARSIDSDEVIEKASDLIEKYDSKDNSYDFEVVWSDGFVSKMSDVDKDNNRKITYIPQLYISKLVDEKNELIGFNKLILDAIKELDKTLEIDGSEQTISNYYDETLTKINSTAAELTKLINDLFNEIEINTNIKEEIKELGNSSTIKKEVDKKKDLIKELTKKSALTDEQTDLLNSLKTQEETNNSLIEKYEQQLATINYFNELLDQNIDDYKISLESIKFEIKDDFEIEEVLEDQINIWITNFNTKIREQLTETKQQIKAIIGEYESKLNDKKTEMVTIKEKLKPLLEKILNQQQLEELNDEITNQNAVLKNLDELNKQLQKSNKKYDEIKSNIIEKYSDEFNLYIKLVEALKNDDVRKIDSIEIQTSLVMSNKRFRSHFTDMFDNRSHLNNDSSLFNEQNELVFDQLNHINLVNELFTKLLENKASYFVLKYNSLKDAILKLFENYFEISFDILFKGDNLLQMSPGKIGLVLIHLYLQFSNAKYPILVDQPEENLDNRTVYEELVDFIREKKIQRQIIIVTHNPNLVVSTDSEQIIVCNQSGQQVNKDNKEYLFEYVSGSIEFTSIRDESKEGILYQMGIREHVCDILEGGEEAFAKENKNMASHNLPPNWSWVKLGDVVKIVSGNTPRDLSQISGDGKIPFFKVSDMNAEGNDKIMFNSNIYLTKDEIIKLKIKLFPKYTTIFPKRGGAILTNKKRLLNEESTFDLNIMGAIPNEIVNYKYLHYWFIGLDLSTIYDGSNVPQINNKNVVPLDFPLPPFPEQKKIVEKIEELFSDLENGVASLKKAKEQIKLYRQSVLNSAFNGKLIGNSNVDEKTGLPKGWKWMKLKEIVNIVSGNTPKGLNEVSNIGKIPYYKVKDMNTTGNEMFMKQSNIYLSKEDVRDLKINIYPMDTTIFPKRGGAILTNKKRLLRQDSAFDLNIMGAIPSNKIYYLFLYYWFIRLDLATIYDGSNVPQINNKNVEPLDFPLAPMIQQTHIVEEIEKCFSEADNLEKAIDESLTKAEALRQSILKQAFEGRLIQPSKNK